MRPRCPFTFRGPPSTAPNTPEDAKRIALSRWITAILVRDGDEPAGAYLTPGASGYTDEQLATADKHYAHLNPEPTVPEEELQRQCLHLLREGVAQSALETLLPVTQAMLVRWRTDAVYLAKWENARAEGKKNPAPQSNALRDSKAAERTMPAPARITAPAPSAPLQAPAPSPAPKTKVLAADQLALQEKALQQLREGVPASKVRLLPGVNNQKLADWRKNKDFAERWDAARLAGAQVRGEKQATVATPLTVAVPRTEPPTQAPDEPALLVPAQPEASRFAVVSQVTGGLIVQNSEWLSERAAITLAEQLAKEFEQTVFVLRVRAEIAPEITITTTLRRC